MVGVVQRRIDRSNEQLGEGFDFSAKKVSGLTLGVGEEFPDHAKTQDFFVERTPLPESCDACPAQSSWGRD